MDSRRSRHVGRTGHHKVETNPWLYLSFLSPSMCVDISVSGTYTLGQYSNVLV